GATMREAMRQNPIDLVILDLMLPGEDGFSLTRRLRIHSQVGIIILTGKGETVDRVVGLEVGADDYLAKPFDLRELLARVKSVLRRTRRTASGEGAKPGTMISFAGWRLDPNARRLFSPKGVHVPLTTGEFQLLSVFLDHPNRVLSRDQLLDFVHGRDAGPFDRSMDMQVGRLRRKIEEDPENPTLIQTVRAAGYIFTPAVKRG
ncbi:MAG TPA: winged helix-turn-helix domain-containing protein, partial [Burkholderiales bacterium]|nr:winged helix-turn-helix domain-containing protein [Burkholderiales bacterium]